MHTTTATFTAGDSGDQGFVVYGTVCGTTGKPRLGLAVVAFDRDLRRQQCLGAASTDGSLPVGSCIR
jgi:hypothetical protein